MVPSPMSMTKYKQIAVDAIRTSQVSAHIAWLALGLPLKLIYNKLQITLANVNHNDFTLQHAYSIVHSGLGNPSLSEGTKVTHDPLEFGTDIHLVVTPYSTVSSISLNTLHWYTTCLTRCLISVKMRYPTMISPKFGILIEPREMRE